MNYESEFIDELARNMPPFFTRADAKKATFGVIDGGYLAVLACKGVGPRCVKMGGKVLYRKDDFIQWLKERRHGEQQYPITHDKFGRRAYCQSRAAEIFA